MDEEKTPDLFEERKSLEKKLNATTDKITESLAQTLLTIVETFEEYDDGENLADLAYGMPEAKIIEKVKKLDNRYTEKDVCVVLNSLEEKRIVRKRRFDGEPYTAYSPIGGFRCGNKENFPRLKKQIDLLNDIYD